MTYQVVRVEKRKSTQIGGMQRHNLRQYDDKTKAPKNIDSTLIEKNITLLKCANFAKAIQERVDAVQAQQKRKIRKDCPTSLEYVISAGADFFEKSSSEERYRYFSDSLEFLKKRHGAENVISAVVHMDEETPHMHVVVVPIRKVKDGIKLDPKHFMDKFELPKLHSEFNAEIGQKYGLERGESSADTHHKTTAEHNRELKRENRDLLSKNSTLKEILDLGAERDAIKSEIEELKEADFKVPQIVVPKPKFTERVNIEAYGERVANYTIEKIVPSFKVARAHYTEAKALKAENQKLKEQNQKLIDENTSKTRENEKLQAQLVEVSKMLKNVSRVLQFSLKGHFRDVWAGFKTWAEDVFIQKDSTLIQKITENVVDEITPKQHQKAISRDRGGYER